MRGFDGDEDGGLFPEMRPDLRSSHDLGHDPQHHRRPGADAISWCWTKRTAAWGPRENGEKSTIVKRLINGEKGVPGIPVVWGISATVERFNKAMEGAQGAARLPPVTVDADPRAGFRLVEGHHRAGHSRRGDGRFRHGAGAPRDRQAAGVAQRNGRPMPRSRKLAKPSLPLMVLQVPNTPNPNDIGRALDTIFQQWPELPETSVAHVFGEHTTQTFGKYSVPYISAAARAG